MRKYILMSILVMSFMAGVVFAGQEEEADTVKTLSESDELEARVVQILNANCASSTCHGGDNPKMKLSLEADDIPENMIDVPSQQNGELMLIDTKDPSQSYLLLKLTGGVGIKGKKMPVMMPPLKDDDMKDIMTWVRGFAAPADEDDDEDDEEDEDDEG
jgi:mono/diheme cytochrome c family protein